MLQDLCKPNARDTLLHVGTFAAVAALIGLRCTARIPVIWSVRFMCQLTQYMGAELAAV